MRVLVADDEAPARARLIAFLAECAGVAMVGEAAHGEAVLAQIAALAPEVILLDVRMPGPDGLEIARQLGKLLEPPAIIFTTAFEEHALAAFDVEAVDYLLKPVRLERLRAALEKAARWRASAAVPEAAAPRTPARTHLSAWRRGRLELMPVEEIRYLRADQGYLTVAGLGRELLLEASLREMEEEFGARFLRVHRAVLVAPWAVAALVPDTAGSAVVLMRDGEEALPVSRRLLPGIRRRLQHLLPPGAA